jgi:hypothetical protein
VEKFFIGKPLTGFGTLSGVSSIIRYSIPYYPAELPDYWKIAETIPVNRMTFGD